MTIAEFIRTMELDWDYEYSHPQVERIVYYLEGVKNLGPVYVWLLENCNAWPLPKDINLAVKATWCDRWDPDVNDNPSDKLFESEEAAAEYSREQRKERIDQWAKDESKKIKQ